MTPNAFFAVFFQNISLFFAVSSFSFRTIRTLRNLQSPLALFRRSANFPFFFCTKLPAIGESSAEGPVENLHETHAKTLPSCRKLWWICVASTEYRLQRDWEKESGENTTVIMVVSYCSHQNKFTLSTKSAKGKVVFLYFAWRETSSFLEHVRSRKISSSANS